MAVKIAVFVEACAKNHSTGRCKGLIALAPESLKLEIIEIGGFHSITRTMTMKENRLQYV